MQRTTYCHYSPNLLATYHLKKNIELERKRKANPDEKRNNGGTRRSEETKSTHESITLYPVVI